MKNISAFILQSVILLSLCSTALADLPRVTGLALTGDRLTWDAQEGATGYNIHLDYDYYDTVRGGTEYTVTLPGRYHVISFNDQGEFGVTRNPDEIGQPYIYAEYEGSDNSVDYDLQLSGLLIVTRTCTDVGPGETCIATCPGTLENQFGSTVSYQYMSGGACSTSDIVEADAFVSPLTYRCTVPTFSGVVTAQAICIPRAR